MGKELSRTNLPIWQKPAIPLSGGEACSSGEGLPLACPLGHSAHVRTGNSKPAGAGLKGFARALWASASFLLALVGLAGLPDDIAKWQTWLDAAMHDPRVTMLAEQAVQIAQFVNQWWVRGLLILAPVVILSWNWRRFRNVRSRIGFRLKAMVKDTVWVSETAATALVRNSDWLNGRRPEKTVSLLDLAAIPGLRTKIVDPEAVQLDGFIRLVLKRFGENHSDKVRQTEGQPKEFDEAALLSYLDRAFAVDLQKKFGDIPD